MSTDKFFLDSSIFINSFDQSAPHKRNISKRLIEQSLTEEACISYQVIEDFMSVCLRVNDPPMTAIQAQKFIQDVLAPLCDFYPTKMFYPRVIEIHERWKLDWSNALIIASALETGCELLFSEDLQHNLKVETLTIINPFVNY